MSSAGNSATEEFIAALLEDDTERLYDRAPCGFLSLTPDGTIIKANATFCDMSGRARSELVGKVRFAELLTRGGQIYYETHYAPLLRMHGQAREIALELARPGAAALPVLVNAVQDSDERGQPQVVRAAVFDASQRRQYEQELLEQSRRLAASEARARGLAETLQQTLIPPLPPAVPGLDVGACYRPAGDGSEVGGDFYDIFQTSEVSWVVVLGDVCGKGAEAAVLTALSRYTLRAAAMQDPRPSHALGVLNQVLHQHASDRFATAVCLELRAQGDRWSVQIAHGGHPLVLLRDVDGSVSTVGRPGDVLGLFTAVETPDHVVDLLPGQALLAYTDGVPEARASGALYGEDRISEVLARPLGSAQERLDELLDDVLAFGNGRSSDDIACVMLLRPLEPSADLP
ncbi:MAG TPA: SpoIIE family protein phosphatase [Mycobacteriales bacterium]|nr:SpoIIE family protein phosphatase [Mycobacteriales bacterium]